jgi:dTDP-glucose 4,6-dehydratase
MRIVVTGGAGFIGSALCRTLVAERGATVLNLDKLTATSSLASLTAIAQSPRYSFRKIDVCDREHVAAVLHAFAPDAIIHAAAERLPHARYGSAPAAIETNVLGTWRVLEAARDYWSSLPAARQAAFRFLSVSAAGRQLTPEAASRAGADELVLAWHKSYGLPAIVSKAAATFGPYQFPAEAIPSLVIAACDGLAGDGKATDPAAWLYLDDHVTALLAMLERGVPGATYAPAGAGLLAQDRLAARIAELMSRHGRERPAFAMATSSAQVTIPVEGGSTCLSQHIGWRPQETAETALSKTVRWYLANEGWWRPLAAAQVADNRFGLLKIA